MPNNGVAPEFTEFIIKTDSIQLITDNLYKELGKVSLNKKGLDIVLNRDELHFDYKIQRHTLDTLILKDSSRYLRDNYLFNGNFESYDLINISTGKLLSHEKLFFGIIHYYNSRDGDLKIRCGDKMSNFSDIPLFLDGGHRELRGPREILVFLGNGIDLRELRKLYYALAYSGTMKTTLVTKAVGLKDREIFEDTIEIWWDEIEKYHQSQVPSPPPLPPHPKFGSKKQYLSNSAKQVTINSSDEIEKLESMNDKDKYLVVINQNLSVEDYIIVKQRLKYKKRINKSIRTAIE